MANIRKYAFDTEFAPGGSEVVRPDGPQRMTAEALEAERAAAYERGKTDALAAAERDAAAALQKLAAAATAILDQLNSESRAMRGDAARIAMAAARKIAGAALDAYGAERAAVAVEAAMDALRHQPRLVVKLPADAAEILRGRIDQMRETHAYAGAILVRAEPNMKVGELSVDWSDGLITLSPEETANRIDTLIEAALAAASHPEQEQR